MADVLIPDAPHTSGGTPGVSQSGVGGFIQDVGQFLTGSNNPLTNAMVLPAVGTAINQYNNAGHYEELGNQAADRADPFGQYRRGYGDRLQALYDDPSQIANTPGYKFALNQALDATQGRLASMGYGGTGTMADSLAAQASGLAQQTFNQERNALMTMAGAQFDPANAARMQMEGGRQAIDARNAALDALFTPFGPGAQGFNSGGAGNPQNTSNPLTNPANIAALAAKFPGLINPQTGEIAPYFRNPDGSINWGEVQTQFNLNNQPMPFTDGTIQEPLEPFNPTPGDIGLPDTDFSGIINDQVPIDDLNPYQDLDTIWGDA